MKSATGPVRPTFTAGRERFDVEAVKASASLRDIIESDLGPPARGRKWLCPFHDDHSPSLDLWDDGRRWTCRSCGEKGDVVEWVMRREGLTFVEAVRRLAGDPTPASRPPRPKASRPSTPPKPAPWQDPAWQAEVDRIVTAAADRLWSPAGRAALDWLHARGLADHCIRRFRLGFIPADGRSARIEAIGKPIRASRGVAIPWGHPEAWYEAGESPPAPRWVGCNVRRLDDDFGTPDDEYGKYRALTGSTRGHAYPFTHTAPTVPTVIVEGELDALVAWQQAGWLANPLTVGGATQKPTPEAEAALRLSPMWLLGFDHDQSGDEAAAHWRARSPLRCRRLHLPHGKDLGEFHMAGGDVPGWLRSELARFGWGPEGPPP